MVATFLSQLSPPDSHNTTSPFDAPDGPADLSEVQKLALRVHARDLALTHQQEQAAQAWSGYFGVPFVGGRIRELQRVQKSKTFALVRVVFKNCYSLLSAFAHNPILPLSSPIEFAYSVAALALLTWGLTLCDICLFLFEKLGGYTVVGLISRQYCKDYSLVNMSFAETFDRKDTLAIVNAAGPVLSSTIVEDSTPTSLPSMHGNKSKCRTCAQKEGGMTQPTLGGSKVTEMNLDLAKTLLILASIVYERQEVSVSDAAAFPQWSMQRLFDSERKIHDVAASYGFRFASISDFGSVAGSFAGAFYPKSGAPFIVLAMKGTTPSNFNEFIVDSSIDKTDANSHLFGSCHYGFYSSLFPSSSSGSLVNPYRRICELVQAIADELHQDGRVGENARIPLWITGHSLGAALSSLLYARLLSEQEDLGKRVQLRDAYVFGCPRVGDARFCAEFEKLLDKPINACRSLWRISNAQDVVAQVPPGLADDQDRRIHLSPASILNYGHIGTGIHLSRDDPGCYRVEQGIRVGDVVLVTESGAATALRAAARKASSVSRKSVEGAQAPPAAGSDAISAVAIALDLPLFSQINAVFVASLMMKYLAPWARDHFPSRYFAALSRVQGLVGQDHQVFTNMAENGPASCSGNCCSEVTLARIDTNAGTIEAFVPDSAIAVLPASDDAKTAAGSKLRESVGGGGGGRRSPVTSEYHDSGLAEGMENGL